MRRLYLMRHAKSSWDDPVLADFDRPLAPRGRKACKKLAKHLRRAGIRPDVVLCSPARRARETVELIGDAFGESAVRFEDDLYAASTDHLLARLRAVPEGTTSVLLVGHNPALQDLATGLAPGPTGLAETFPTGALASFALEGAWSDLGQGTVRLLEYVVPRELP